MESNNGEKEKRRNVNKNQNRKSIKTEEFINKIKNWKGIKNKKVLVAIVTAILIIDLGLLASCIYNNYLIKQQENNNQKEENNNNIINMEQEKNNQIVEKEVQIFKGNDRPIAIMIDNEKPAWPHAGLNDAYLLYEIIIEGGESRIMALFKGKNTEKIGPVRSARHYFLDYVIENDAQYVHFGWSPKAQSDIKSYNINNINGVTGDSKIFWREGKKNSYHNAFTNIENILDRAEEKKYRKESEDIGVFKYTANEINLVKGLNANNIKIKYSSLQNVEYKYNAEKKVYERYMRGQEHKDRDTGEFFIAKNIVVCYIKNGLLDDPENKGRQELYNIGKGEGVFITNGKYINITWEKKDRNTKTKYYDENGEEIVLNDGITWIQIVPINNIIEIE